MPYAHLFRKEGWAYGKAVLAWLLCFAIFAGRSWLRLQAQQLFAEDGSIFFAAAYNQGWLTALITPYAGYYHLLPRLLAGAAFFFPFAYTPLVYAAAAITVNATAAAWLQLPQYRYLIRNDWIRLAVVLLIALSPNAEGVNLISYVQWFVVWWAVLVVLVPLDNPWLRTFVVIAYVIAIWTAPILIVLLPLWLLRAWRTRSRYDMALAALLTGSHLAVLLSVAGLKSSEVGLPVDWGNSLNDFGHAYAYRLIGAGLLGDGIVEQLWGGPGWPALFGFAIAATLLLLAALWWLLRSLPPEERARRAAIWSLAYVAAAATSMYLLRVNHHHLPFLTDEALNLRSNLRYFFIGGAILIVLLGIVADAACRRRPRGGEAGAVLAFALLAAFYLSSFEAIVYPGVAWTPYGRWLDGLRRQQGGQPAPVAVAHPVQPTPERFASWPQEQPYRLYAPYIAHVPPAPAVSIAIAPPGWRAELHPAPAVAFTQLPEDLNIAGATTDVNRQGVETINLFWQAAGNPNTEEPRTWRVALAVRDAAGAELACGNLTVSSPTPWRWPDELFYTPIELTRPADWPATVQLTLAAGDCAPTTQSTTQILGH